MICLMSQGCPADNLLKAEGAHKWKTTAPAEKHATVVLQFEKASLIHSIDIGNEGSAFVEVLGGKSSAKEDKDYQVLLVASSFMNPMDSRNNTNRNMVRMFGKEKFSKTAVSEKWDRVKIVCTQPFNKTSSYGLSFIKFHSPPAAGEKEESTIGAKKLGAFLIKPEKEDDIHMGSVFAKRSEVKETPPATGAAAIRAASRLSEESRSTSVLSSPAATLKSKPSQVSSSHKTSDNHSSFKSEVSESSSSKPSKTKAAPKMSENRSKRKHEFSDDEGHGTDEDDSAPPKPSMRKQSTSISSTASSVRSDHTKPALKKIKSEPVSESPVKSFKRLMEGVVFALSGFQNPFRAELRDMATEMGGVYKADWDKKCTHLICAFVNTPKYNQVRGKGRIVKKDWIQHCYKQKKFISWRKYQLGDADYSSDEEDEEEAPVMKKKTPVPSKHKANQDDKASSSKGSSSKKAKLEVYDDNTDVDSGEDTEDEVRRIKQKMEQNDKPKSNEADVYGDSTDNDEVSSKSAPRGNSKMEEEEDDSNDSGLPELPDFFTNKNFFLYGDFSVSERRLLIRYITAYNGELENYMSDQTNYVLTYNKWDDNFDEALADNSKLVFVKPKWIYACHEKYKTMPFQPYSVVPE
ncbi:DNA repair protein XRCC1 [Mizuhopecten yessoensis]|uniref:DNA repair protein XRCC1 n=1 Tax=Mizuhopecten yessoensis TaxID=6573 RepID=A0A210PGK4_MIZYE|nr:DNA repair protein XRCC1 [Mizuhopecten yessoensis]